jgi:acetoin utilization deacetylase AcuC-like enzyme
MSAVFITHPAFLEHDTGQGHPERPDRLRAIWKALDDPSFAALIRESAPEASVEQLARVHPRDYVDAILAIDLPPGRLGRIDADTIVSAGSIEAAKRAAGAAIAGVDAVFGGRAKAAFAAVRPPGHHAGPAEAGGFCIFNNVAVGAQHARAAHGIERVAVLDFDVHHGQGTQAVCGPDPKLFYASTHQSPLYPGTGAAGERGVAGNVVNVPLSPGTDGAGFRHAWANTILPALDAFGPELVMISAGFDAHTEDPLANLDVETQDFAWLTEELAAVAGKHAGGRVVSLLEGGYDLDALAEAAAAHVRALMRG